MANKGYSGWVVINGIVVNGSDPPPGWLRFKRRNQAEFTSDKWWYLGPEIKAFCYQGRDGFWPQDLDVSQKMQVRPGEWVVKCSSGYDVLSEEDLFLRYRVVGSGDRVKGDWNPWEPMQEGCS